MKADALLGCLLGGAVGDALGLPAEGIGRKRLALWRGEWKHRLVLGRGMFSDDTEHTLMVAAALVHSADVAAFRATLAGSLRWGLAALPAGTGLATARAIVRLWRGISPEHSGVRSAGNGAGGMERMV
jgi:ADP-ribosyl-[dinitrogen reductase] hydrolase